jgi:hypothetical protein
MVNSQNTQSAKRSKEIKKICKQLRNPEILRSVQDMVAGENHSKRLRHVKALAQTDHEKAEFADQKQLNDSDPDSSHELQIQESSSDSELISDVVDKLAKNFSLEQMQ